MNDNAYLSCKPVKTIGVTGGTGFIGQYLLREFKDRYRFVVLSSGSSKERLLVTDSSIDYVVGDYSEECICDAFRECDCIIHMASRRSSVDAEKAFSNYMCNLRVSESVFRAGKQLGITNLVNISSTAVYSTAMRVPWSEGDASIPMSFYGASKRAIELCADLYNQKHGMRIKSLRLAQVIGFGERAGYILSVFLDRCTRKLPLTVYGEGKSGKEYIYVKDVVNALILAAKAPERFGVFNIGSGMFVSNRELAETFCSVFENEAGFHFARDKAEIVNTSFMSIERAKTELGFSCEYSLEQALIDLKHEMELQQDA